MTGVDVSHLRAGQTVRVTHKYGGHTAVTEGVLWDSGNSTLLLGDKYVRSIGSACYGITAVEVLADPMSDWVTTPSEVVRDEGRLWQRSHGGLGGSHPWEVWNNDVRNAADIAAAVLYGKAVRLVSEATS